MFLLGLLAAVVVLVMMYLGDCVPGFGAGGTLQPGTPEPAPRTSEPAPTAAAIAVKVDGKQCQRGAEPLGPCADLCKALAAEPKTTKIEVDGTLGTHAAVDELKRCLTEQGFRDVVVRAE